MELLSAGYNRFSFTRASAVVNCQSALSCIPMATAAIQSLSPVRNSGPDRRIPDTLNLIEEVAAWEDTATASDVSTFMHATPYPACLGGGLALRSMIGVRIGGGWSKVVPARWARRSIAIGQPLRRLRPMERWPPPPHHLAPRAIRKTTVDLYRPTRGIQSAADSFACCKRIAIWNQSRSGGFITRALAKTARKPGQPSVKAVTSVASVRPTVSRVRFISAVMSVSPW